MATETGWSCPICRNTQDDVTYEMPCGHEFCLGCVVRWIGVKPECPLCRTQRAHVRFSMQGEEDYHLQCVIRLPEAWPDVSSQAGRAAGRLADNRTHRPVASPPSAPQGMLSPEEQGAAGPEAVGGLLPKVWAELFQREEDLLDLVLPWLRQKLEAIYGAQWWQAKSAESSILHALCVYGPNGDVMVQVLQDCLGEHTAPLVHGVIDIIVCQCSEEARRLLRCHAARQEDNSPAASSSSSSSSSCQGGTPAPHLASSSSPAGSNVEEQPRTLEATLRRQEQPQEELREVVVAGPSAQGCSRSPSAPGGGRDSSCRARWHPPKRRAPTPLDSPQPCKRPCP
ncbi:TOPRS ligase, partial [Ciconia maguari]|nr:TOPRS ligase [Ciconia maguari]